MVGRAAKADSIPQVNLVITIRILITGLLGGYVAEAAKIFDMATWPCSSQCLQDAGIDLTSNHPTTCQCECERDVNVNVNVSDTTERIPLCKETLSCQMTISNF